MICPRRPAARAFAIALLLTMSFGVAEGAGAPARAQVLGIDAYWLTVANIDRSLAFYHDVLGFSVVPATPLPARQAILQRLSATPGARIRTVTLSTPGGTALRLLEFDNTPRRVQHPHAVDPGAVVLQVQVRNLDSVLEAATRAHVPAVTRGAAPVRLAGGTRAIVLSDPDGFFVLISDPASASLPFSVRYIVAAPVTLVRFYRQTLGLSLVSANFEDAGPWATLFNVARAQMALAMPTATPRPARAGSLVSVQFAAFRRVARHTYDGRPQDPGTSALSLRVANLRVALTAARAAGVRVLSAGGQPVVLPDGGAAVLFRDPSGMLINLVQP
jgi:catechol 2,3-dioxygenase-like lactoylglutathione lyase family enzyme